MAYRLLIIPGENQALRALQGQLADEIEVRVFDTANDALWEAKIDPKRPANSLSEKEIKTMYDAILKVMRKGLEEGGASELSYVNALGQEGQYQKHFLAYAQDGKPCKRCGTTMEKYMLAGRGTYVCPKCQK